jgi:F-type H+-transporting ATPase subunit alpha
MDPSLRTLGERLGRRAREADVGVILRADRDTVHVGGLMDARLGEAVSFEDGGVGVVHALLFDHVQIRRLSGAAASGVVTRTGGPVTVPAGPGLRGRVIDALGGPLDGAGPVTDTRQVSMRPTPLPWLRRQWGLGIASGIPWVDFCAPVAEGYNVLVSGAAMSGRSTLAIDLLAGFLRSGDGPASGVYACQSAPAAAWVRERLRRLGVADRVTLVVAQGAQTAAAAASSAVAIGAEARSRGERAIVVVDDLPIIEAAIASGAGALFRFERDALLRDLRCCAGAAGERVDRLEGSLTVIWVDARRPDRAVDDLSEEFVDAHLRIDTRLDALSGRLPPLSVHARTGGLSPLHFVRKRFWWTIRRWEELKPFLAVASRDVDAETLAADAQGDTAAAMLTIHPHEYVSLACQVARFICWDDGQLADLPLAEVAPFLRALDEHLLAAAPELLAARAPGSGRRADPKLVGAIRDFRRAWRGPG